MIGWKITLSLGKVKHLCLCKLFIADDEPVVKAYDSGDVFSKGFYGRCRQAKVLEIYKLSEVWPYAPEKAPDGFVTYSAFVSAPRVLEYIKGETVEADDLDTRDWLRCVPGLHFCFTAAGALSAIVNLTLGDPEYIPGWIKWWKEEVFEG